MKKYTLKLEDIYKGNLILVNSDYKINSPIDNNNLESFNYKYNGILLEKNTNKVLQEILNKIDSKDNIVPVSGYRSLSEQESIYNNSILENGLQFTQKYVALPNSSEHQTGLAIDLGLNKGKIDFIRPSFPRNGICDEFRRFSIFYGFIERYKEDKKSITNISSEEWHFRYVGYPHSEIMTENNLCLEEYIQYLKNYNYGISSLRFKNYQISYIPYEGKDINIYFNDKDNVSISGNNVDGFIITMEL